MNFYKNFKTFGKVALIFFGISYAIGLTKTSEVCYYKQIKVYNSRTEYKSLEKKAMEMNFPLDELSVEELFSLRKNLGVEDKSLDFKIPYEKIDSLYGEWFED